MHKNRKLNDGYARGTGDGRGCGCGGGDSRGVGSGWGTITSGDYFGTGDGGNRADSSFSGAGDLKGQGVGRGCARGYDYGGVGDGTGPISPRGFAALEICYKDKLPQESDT